MIFFLHQKLVSVDQKERKEMQEELVLAESEFFFFTCCLQSIC